MNMESSTESAAGAELEQALLELGPLLASVKEEAPDLPALHSMETVEGTGSPPKCEPTPEMSTAGPDSLASPTAGRPSWSALRCVFCGGTLAHTEGAPKLMECLHSACEPCIKAKIEEKQSSGRDFLGAEKLVINCGACRLQCQPCNMIEQRFVLEKVTAENAVGAGGGVNGSTQCSSCEDTEPATSYCVECGDFICDSCVSAHQRLKITKEHSIKSREEALQELHAAGAGAVAGDDMFCREHPAERLALFCETCDRLTCRDCQLIHHRDHKYQFSAEMAAQARQNITALLSEVSYKRVLLGSAMKVIRDRQALIADKKKSLVREITQTVVKLTNAINTRGKELVLRLNEVCDAKQKILTEKKDALQQLSAITDHCIEFVNAALEQGSDTAVLYSKRAVCLHLQRIKSRRADIPNPEIPVRISLALDKLPELIKVLSSIGGIVVDGKVDGAGVSHGPYHPPSPAPAPPPVTSQPPALLPGPSHPAQHPAHPAHTAAVALQQVAMQQSYVQQPRAGGVSPGVGGPQHGPHSGPHPAPPSYSSIMTALRHPHVSSTTHPHHLHGVNEMNLRGLLNPVVARSSLQQRHMQHAYQQVMGGYPAGMTTVFQQAGPARRAAPRAPSPKWHIPQHAPAAAMYECGAVSPAAADYKIALGRVTSTNPKTPSPSLNGALDRVCADSVQDLMATIAKLDSNGVQVLPERAADGLVHSSTAPPPAVVPGVAPAPAVAPGTTPAAAAPPDPNEDWCAVCMDGGELVCCDKCPKVFHQFCHIPTVTRLPDEADSWQCLLCLNFAELPADVAGPGSPARLQRVMERITLELYCQYESSLPFREPVSPDNEHYHRRVSRPMCLDQVRARLQPHHTQRYTSPGDFVADVRLIFTNAYDYNQSDSQIYKDAQRLEEFFEAQLVKWLPELTVRPHELPGPAIKRPRC